MKISLEPGKYIVAVSGGVDSMVLLDLLAKQPDFGLVVAHFDHGIREDSEEDRKLVEKAAKDYGVKFEFDEGKLGTGASEETARNARYKFLRKIQKKYSAKAIITAHHQDDLLETAFINIIRGTGRKGLTSLSSDSDVLRPLLSYNKNELIKYAKEHDLHWGEDSTNQDTQYLRNYVRQNVIPKLSQKEQDQLVTSLTNLKDVNQEIDKEIAKYLQKNQANRRTLDKKLLNNLHHDIAREVMAEWLRTNNIRDFDSKTIERLVVAIKTFKPGQRADINKKNYLYIDKYTLVIKA